MRWSFPRLRCRRKSANLLLSLMRTRKFSKSIPKYLKWREKMRFSLTHIESSALAEHEIAIVIAPTDAHSHALVSFRAVAHVTRIQSSKILTKMLPIRHRLWYLAGMSPNEKNLDRCDIVNSAWKYGRTKSIIFRFRYPQSSHSTSVGGLIETASIKGVSTHTLSSSRTQEPMSNMNEVCNTKKIILQTPTPTNS